jgi:deleted-in-malignant-brain-tumors protein 1
MFPYKWTANFDVAVANCTDGEARLVDGPSTNKGRLEVCHNQAWATVCNSGFGTEESRVICGQLGFQRYGNTTTVCSIPCVT